MYIISKCIGTYNGNEIEKLLIVITFFKCVAEGSLEKDKSLNNTNLDVAAKPELSVVAESKGKVDTKTEQPAGRGWYYNDEEDKYSLCETESETDESRYLCNFVLNHKTHTNIYEYKSYLKSKFQWAIK